jgi:uncharacterized protein YndB with AHSA1/START domain
MQQTIKKSIEINTSPEIVWKALIDTNNYAIWATAFTPIAIVKTDWEEGSKVTFSDGNYDGLFGRIISHIPNKEIVFEYDGQVLKGVEDTESEDAKVYIGTHERYYLTETDGVVTLHIEVETTDEYVDMMSPLWDAALLKVKDLAEKIE